MKPAPGVITSTKTLAVDPKSAVAKFPTPSVPANTLSLFTTNNSRPPVIVTTIVGTRGLGVRLERPPRKLRAKVTDAMSFRYVSPPGTESDDDADACAGQTSQPSSW
jgi:hypothetical protein